MRTTLMSAAILIPVSVLANDPMKMKGHEGAAMSPTQVLNKLHRLSQKGIEKATFAQTNSTNEKLKTFVSKTVKDYQQLDQAAIDLARERKIVLASLTDPSPAEDLGTRSGMPARTEPGTPGIQPSPDPARAGADPARATDPAMVGTEPGKPGSPTVGTPPPTDTQLGSSAPRQPFETKSIHEQKQARWEQIRSLRGSEFDTQFLSMSADNAKSMISILESSRTRTDKKLDGLIDKAVRIFKDHQEQAEKLQRDLRAS